MRVDALALRLRPRTPMEAVDLGVRLCQSATRSVYPCYLVVAVPVIAFAFTLGEIADWLPTFVVWWAKPWFDRTILFVLSRAAFGQTTRPADLWREQRKVWWSQLLFTLTVQRLSFWRSLTQPVYQLEGVSTWRAGARVRQIRRRCGGQAVLMTYAFTVSEAAVNVSLLSLAFWFAPAGQAPDFVGLITGTLPGIFSQLANVTYVLAVLFVEPFFVAAGFAMYLNRRVELEAWDIEQEFRRAFAN